MSPTPTVPLIRIRACGPAQDAGLRAVWASRELLLSFCEREFAVRHRQTLLGPFWTILQPLLHTAVFVVFMHNFARVPSDGAPYSLFAYAGLIPWLFVSNSVQSLSYGLMMNAHLVTRVYFPRLIIPLSMILVRLFDFGAATLAFFVVAAALGVSPSVYLFLLPLFMLHAAVLALAVGAWCSCLISRYRDFGTLLPVVLQLAMFGSPVIYPSSLVPAHLRSLYFLNPMAAIVEAFRDSILGRPFAVEPWLVSFAITIVLAYALIRSFVGQEQHAVESL